MKSQKSTKKGVKKQRLETANQLNTSSKARAENAI